MIKNKKIVTIIIRVRSGFRPSPPTEHVQTSLADLLRAHNAIPAGFRLSMLADSSHRSLVIDCQKTQYFLLNRVILNVAVNISIGIESVVTVACKFHLTTTTTSSL
jgi:hypothetical protein